MYLSEHFTLEEMIATQHRGIDNTPPPSAVENLTSLCALLEVLRARYNAPMHVNSGYRSDELNYFVGGQLTSQHREGLACDFIVPGLPLTAAARVLLFSPLKYDQFIYEFGSWLHISHAPRDRPPRKQALMVGKWTGGHYLPFDFNALPSAQ